MKSNIELVLFHPSSSEVQVFHLGHMFGQMFVFFPYGKLL